MRLTGGFQGRAIELRQTNSTATSPRFHDNEIWDKIGYNSAYIRDSPEILAQKQGVFGVELSNDVNKILQRPTLVAMATKSETKQAITALV